MSLADSQNPDEALAAPDLLGPLVATLVALRPDWEPGLVRIVLHGNERHVDAADLVVAAVRCAAAPSRLPPKAIGWRGPHWAGLATTPPAAAPRARCGVCGKTEDRCALERWADDDHTFEPTRTPGRP